MLPVPSWHKQRKQSENCALSMSSASEWELNGEHLLLLLLTILDHKKGYKFLLVRLQNHFFFVIEVSLCAVTGFLHPVARGAAHSRKQPSCLTNVKFGCKTHSSQVISILRFFSFFLSFFFLPRCFIGCHQVFDISHFLFKKLEGNQTSLTTLSHRG